MQLRRVRFHPHTVLRAHRRVGLSTDDWQWYWIQLMGTLPPPTASCNVARQSLSQLNQHRQTGRGPPLRLSDYIILDLREFLVSTSGLKPQSQMIRQNIQIASNILNKISSPNNTGCRFCFYPSCADHSPQIPNFCNPLIAKFGQICFSWVCTVYFIGAGSDWSTNHCWREETESRQKRRRRRTVTPQATSSLSPERHPQPWLISECFFIRARGS